MADETPKAVLAEADYMSGMKYKDIAEKYETTLNTVKSWKKRYGWDRKGCTQKEKGAHTKKTVAPSTTDGKEPVKKKFGAPYGNKNAVGHRSSTPKHNKRAEKHGFFSKYLPPESVEVIKEFEESDPLDIIWQNIMISYAAIIRAQKIMYVQDENDKTVEKVKEQCGEKSDCTEWEVQQAWDKQANFLKAQSRAQSELRSLIRQYMDMLYDTWENASEEQRARVEKIRCDIASKSGGMNQGELTKLDEMLAEVKAQAGGNE